jgi:hypothetical protein
MRGLLLIVLMLFMPSALAEQATDTEPATDAILEWDGSTMSARFVRKWKPTLPLVSVIDLVNTSDVYDGKEVLVIGILSLGFEVNRICDLMGMRCVWPNIESGPVSGPDDKARGARYVTKLARLEKFMDKPVVVRGVYEKKERFAIGAGKHQIRIIDVVGDDLHFVKVAKDGSYVWEDDKQWGHDLQFVSVSDLANSSERYHDKKVLVNGYVFLR